jgi:hypothetical protein
MLLAPAAQAGAPYGLRLPLDCVPGTTCWVIRHVDHDPGPGARDYRCGRLTGDGHTGTDFAVRDLAALDEGIEVRAAAAGVVAGRRDGVADTPFEPAAAGRIRGMECGNGVRLDHGDGWESFYCHMRRGSIAVAVGERVAAGQRLGLVGLSGETDFPHLHFDVRHDGRPVDPFVGLARPDPCAAGPAPLWRPEVAAALPYRQPVLSNAGIAPRQPEKAAIRAGGEREPALPLASPMLALWLDAYWVDAGDRISFRLAGPDGAAVITRDFELAHSHQRWFGFASAPRPTTGWPPGVYRGEILVERPGDKGSAVSRIARAVTLR